MITQAHRQLNSLHCTIAFTRHFIFEYFIRPMSALARAYSNNNNVITLYDTFVLKTVNAQCVGGNGDWVCKNKK